MAGACDLIRVGAAMSLSRGGHGGLLIDVDDFQVKIVREVFVADGSKIFDGVQRPRGLPGDVETARYIADRALRATSRARRRTADFFSESAAKRFVFHGAQFPQVQPDQDPLRIGKVADNFTNGLRKIAHQSRNSKDLIVLGELRSFYQVDHMQPVTSLQMFFTNVF